MPSVDWAFRFFNIMTLLLEALTRMIDAITDLLKLAMWANKGIVMAE